MTKFTESKTAKTAKSYRQEIYETWKMDLLRVKYEIEQKKRELELMPTENAGMVNIIEDTRQWHMTAEDLRDLARTYEGIMMPAPVACDADTVAMFVVRNGAYYLRVVTVSTGALTDTMLCDERSRFSPGQLMAKGKKLYLMMDHSSTGTKNSLMVYDLSKGYLISAEVVHLGWGHYAHPRIRSVDDDIVTQGAQGVPETVKVSKIGIYMVSDLENSLKKLEKEMKELKAEGRELRKRK